MPTTGEKPGIGTYNRSNPKCSGTEYGVSVVMERKTPTYTLNITILYFDHS